MALLSSLPPSSPCPPAAALCPQIGSTMMARQNAIVRQLPCMETLGSLTVICSDKTGAHDVMVVEKAVGRGKRERERGMPGGNILHDGCQLNGVGVYGCRAPVCVQLSFAACCMHPPVRNSDKQTSPHGTMLTAHAVLALLCSPLLPSPLRPKNIHTQAP